MSTLDRTIPARAVGARSSAPRRGSAAVIAVTALAAVVVNTVLWAIGALAGGDFVMTQDGVANSVAPGGVEPTRIAPSTITPCASSAARNAPAVNVTGSPTTS